MILYDHPLSSYAQKVKIALREKGVAFERMLPDDFGTGRRDTAFAAVNPRGEVPVLLPDGKTPIFESTVILEYIEECWPEPRLLPTDPLARSYARMTEEVCDTQYEAVNWGFGELLWFRRAEGSLAETLKATAARDTEALQQWLTERLGSADWFGGEGFGWADAAVAPMVNRSVHYGLGPDPGSPLRRWHARLRERPAVAETFAEFDQAAARMAAVADFYRTGGRRREYRDHRLEWMIRSGGIDVVLTGLREDTKRATDPICTGLGQPDRDGLAANRNGRSAKVIPAEQVKMPAAPYLARSAPRGGTVILRPTRHLSRLSLPIESGGEVPPVFLDSDLSDRRQSWCNPT